MSDDSQDAPGGDHRERDWPARNARRTGGKTASRIITESEVADSGGNGAALGPPRTGSAQTHLTRPTISPKGTLLRFRTADKLSVS